MGRKAKYSTLSTYQPFVDYIRRDLGIAPEVEILVKFNDMNKALRMNVAAGWAGFSYGVYTISISRYFNHIATLQFLMHELKHIQQMLDKRLYRRFENRNGNVAWHWYWLGKPVELVRPEVNHDAYMGQEWEKEAYDYQWDTDTLFPDGKLTPIKTYIGAANNGKVKFYKVKG